MAKKTVKINSKPIKSHTYVKAHKRNGSWVKKHFRKGGNVKGHKKRIKGKKMRFAFPKQFRTN